MIKIFLTTMIILTAIGIDAIEAQTTQRLGSRQQLIRSSKENSLKSTKSPKLTQREREIVKRAHKTLKESKGMNPPSKELSDRMQDEVNE